MYTNKSHTTAQKTPVFTIFDDGTNAVPPMPTEPDAITLTTEEQAEMLCLLWEMRDHMRALRESLKWSGNTQALRSHAFLRRAHLQLYGFATEKASALADEMYKSGEYKKVYR